MVGRSLTAFRHFPSSTATTLRSGLPIAPGCRWSTVWVVVGPGSHHRFVVTGSRPLDDAVAVDVLERGVRIGYVQAAVNRIRPHSPAR